MSSLIRHVTIDSADPYVLAGFWAEALDGSLADDDFPGDPEAPGGLGGAIVDAEQSSITLGVVVPDLEQALIRAGDLGGTVTMPPTDNGWAVKAQVQDPVGNILTLIQA